MSGGRAAARSAVPWLFAQAGLFGFTAAVLGVAANSLFLAAFGAGALPVTYLLIGAAGLVVSGTVARAARRYDLLRLAVAVLGGAGILLVLAWLVATARGGAWVAAPMLVLFPIWIQLGFVFIGGQAGRLLDIDAIKASFPRVMSGFPIGAVVGGLLAVPLIGLAGRTEHLVLVSAAADIGFVGLVIATSRRFADRLAVPGSGAGPAAAPERVDHREARPPGSQLHNLVRQPFIALLLGYQVLSALGSQLADFLVYERAAAAFPDPSALARFVAAYTAVMNAVAIGFLFLLAGPLLRRFGLRFGITANPLVVAALAVAMVVVLGAAGAGSAALLTVVASARIADIALTDGATRTSINALYQVLPAQRRIGVQAAVEGIGVPIAIGVSGVLILALRAIPSIAALGPTIMALVLVCIAWTWVSWRLYRAYGPALVAALREQPILDADAVFETTVEDVAAARRLVLAGNPRSARLALELGPVVGSPMLAPELVALVADPRLEVRLPALAALAMSGDPEARARLGEEIRAAVASNDVSVRQAAARVAGALHEADRIALAPLLVDEAPEVRSAAIDAVQPGDGFALEAVLRALDEPATAIAAMRAVGRLGDAAVPALEAALEEGDDASMRRASRLLRSLGTASEVRDAALARHVGHPDRSIGLLALERLAAPEAAAGDAADAVRVERAADELHVRRILNASIALAAADAPLRRGLAEELDLVRRRLIAELVVLHGRARIGPALSRLARAGDDAALAGEAIEVVVGAAEARLLRALLDPSLEPAERLERMGRRDAAKEPAADAAAWLRDLIDDAQGHWRSSWLRACAERAASPATG